MDTRKAYQDIIKQLGPFKELRVNNHWVPITYLKAFTDTGTEAGKLWMYDRKNPRKPKHLPPGVVAKQKYLYVAEIGLEVPDFIERFLDRYIERPYGSIRNKLVYGKKVGIKPHLNANEAYSLALFIAMQQGRTPFARDRAEWLASFHAMFDMRLNFQDIGAVQQQYFKKTGKRPTKSAILGWRDELDTGKLEIRPGHELWLGTFLAGALVATEHILSLRWRLIRAPQGQEFPSSDMPVVLARRVGSQYELGGGWQEDNIEATITLSPQCVLVIGPNVYDDEDIGSTEWCANVIRRTVLHSERFVSVAQKG